MGDDMRIELDDQGLRRLVVATIADAFRVVAAEKCNEGTYYAAHHAATWLETTGSEWAEITGYSINRPTFRAAVNAHLVRHEMAAVSRELSEPAKKPKSNQLKLPI